MVCVGALLADTVAALVTACDGVGRRAVRATLVLVPLFGLHLVVTIYRPAHGTCVWMQIYYYGDYLLDGLQGAMVALIFCYLNGEVGSHFLLSQPHAI